MVDEYLAILTEEIRLSGLHTALAGAEAGATRARRKRDWPAFHAAVLEIDALKEQIEEVDMGLTRLRGQVEARWALGMRRMETIRLFRKHYLRR